MAVRTVIRMGHPVLRRVQPSPIDPIRHSSGCTRSIEDLWDTMHASGGIGIAAPQIAVAWRVVVFGLGGARRQDGLRPAGADPADGARQPGDRTARGRDGRRLGGMPERPRHAGRGAAPHVRIRYTGFDAFGNRIEREVEDYHARVVQHECDHLDGVLYPVAHPGHVHVRVRRGAGHRGLSGGRLHARRARVCVRNDFARGLRAGATEAGDGSACIHRRRGNSRQARDRPEFSPNQALLRAKPP